MEKTSIRHSSSQPANHGHGETAWGASVVLVHNGACRGPTFLLGESTDYLVFRKWSRVIVMIVEELGY